MSKHSNKLDRYLDLARRDKPVISKKEVQSLLAGKGGAAAAASLSTAAKKVLMGTISAGSAGLLTVALLMTVPELLQLTPGETAPSEAKTNTIAQAETTLNEDAQTISSLQDDDLSARTSTSEGTSNRPFPAESAGSAKGGQFPVEAAQTAEHAKVDPLSRSTDLRTAADGHDANHVVPETSDDLSDQPLIGRADRENETPPADGLDDSKPETDESGSFTAIAPARLLADGHQAADHQYNLRAHSLTVPDFALSTAISHQRRSHEYLAQTVGHYNNQPAMLLDDLSAEDDGGRAPQLTVGTHYTVVIPNIETINAQLDPLSMPRINTEFHQYGFAFGLSLGGWIAEVNANPFVSNRSIGEISGNERSVEYGFQSYGLFTGYDFAIGNRFHIVPGLRFQLRSEELIFSNLNINLPDSYNGSDWNWIWRRFAIDRNTDPVEKLTRETISLTPTLRLRVRMSSYLDLGISGAYSWHMKEFMQLQTAASTGRERFAYAFTANAFEFGIHVQSNIGRFLF